MDGNWTRPRRAVGRARTAVLLIAAALPLTACQGFATPPAAGSGTAESSSVGSGAPSSTAAPSTEPMSAEQHVQAVIAGLSREQEIAQLFVVGVRLDDLSQGDDLAAQTPGGIFLAGRSQLPADDLAATTAAWQEAAGSPGLWIAVDQEGGSVQTLSGPGFAELPAAVDQGRLPEGDLAALADGMGASLARAGINLDLAPVADVVPAGTEQSNQPIGVFGREYGSTAAEVAEAAEVVVDGLAAHGVTAVLKHFPGLGRVRGNTDTSAEVVDPDTVAGDPSVRVFGELADAADAPPFVMTSSAIYPGIDGSEPAGWSSKVIDGVLRGQLGFDGVVISDDVGAAAAVQDVAPGERAVRCLAAGGTLVLTVDASLYPEMLAAVLDRDRTDDAFSTRVDAAVRTALLAKAEAGLLPS
jgi:beta-glucosidase-like glycosyl hydrolase